MALNYLFNQSLPPNSSSSRNPNSFRPTPIDDTDRFGIIATNNFDYNSAVATGGDEEIPNQTDTQVEEIPVLEMLNK